MLAVCLRCLWAAMRCGCGLAGILDIFLSFNDKEFYLMPSGGFIHCWKTMQCVHSLFPAASPVVSSARVSLKPPLPVPATNYDADKPCKADIYLQFRCAH